MICKTIRYSVERQTDSKSVTKISERLDFRTLLERASAGILDLRQFQLPRSCDVSGSEIDDPESSQALKDLMDRPRTILDNCFGSSVEEAETEMKRHNDTLSRERLKSEAEKQRAENERKNAEGRDSKEKSLEKQDLQNPS